MSPIEKGKNPYFGWIFSFIYSLDTYYYHSEYDQ